MHRGHAYYAKGNYYLWGNRKCRSIEDVAKGKGEGKSKAGSSKGKDKDHNSSDSQKKDEKSSDSQKNQTSSNSQLRQPEEDPGRDELRKRSPSCWRPDTPWSEEAQRTGTCHAT